ncbi:hypothetical protein EWM64_g1402 [Hericium alpestre]|uniref:Pentacotripeptide-repeat region of PRORP domain-containing protein n=1 Tax=Hericium alpestre TaxID=135208 RepID=A0A4Z0A6E7_9AGAM|nr:hypothetical protein EWM64_g1402 [Hericium alpestre]
MLICRSLILRGHLRAPVLHPSSTRWSSLLKNPVYTAPLDGRLLSSTLPRPETRYVALSLGYDPAAFLEKDSDASGHASPPVPDIIEKERPETAGPAYEAVTAQAQRVGPPAEARLDAPPLPEEYAARMAEMARQCGSSSELDRFARDILAQSTKPQRSEVAYMFLTSDLPLLDRATSLFLFRIIPRNVRTSLPLETALHITPLVLQSSQSSPILRDVATIFCNSLPPLPETDTQSFPPIDANVWICFRVIASLGLKGHPESALQLFTCLVEAGYIPQKAMNTTDRSSKDFNLVMINALVQSCMVWGWNSRALHLLRLPMKTEARLEDSMLLLTVNVVQSILEFATSEDLDLCYQFVESGFRKSRGMFPTDSIVELTYDAAKRLRRGDVAAQLYKFTRSSDVVAVHHFPLPQGPSLLWLFKRLTIKDKNTHLGRVLVKEVVDSAPRIPPRDRAPFIAFAAEHGYASHARALWERHSTGGHKSAVIGSAPVSVRLCSLFASLVKRESRTSEGALFDGDPSQAREAVLEGDGSSSHMEDKQLETPEGTGDGLQVERQTRLDDLHGFASRVVAAFRESKEPLTQASHQDLNALARCYFMLGEVAAGFSMFEILLGRQEVLDMHDVNVALASMAEQDPQAAYRILQRMIARGVRPDSISFGTVLHQAMRQKHFPVVQKVFAMIRAEGEQLTLKTMSSLIRASVLLSGDDIFALRENLRRAQRIIEANLSSPLLPAPNMGKFCVTHALRADDPILAFRFWQMLVQRKVQWSDRQHKLLRAHIRKRAVELGRQGKLLQDTVDFMVSELDTER